MTTVIAEMPPSPSVSVVVNNYNYARYLPAAIDSALAQTYTPLEVIVVDDGSTDDSRAVIARYGDRVIPVLKDNGGQASAFNTGFAASTGDVVIFLDADDVLMPHTVATSIELFSPGVVKVHWPLLEIDAEGATTGVLHPQRELGSGDLRAKTSAEGPLSGMSPPTSGNAFARTLLRSVLPMPEHEFRINADGYLHTLVWVYGVVRTVPEPLGYYRIHGANHFAAKSAEERRSVHLEKFEHQCLVLDSHLRRTGIVPRLEIWKARKGLFDAEVARAMEAELKAAVAPGAPFILVDDNVWATSDLLQSLPSRPIPFLEREGEYWGRPADDAEAIRELDRLRASGARFVVFPSFCYWWLEHYSGFSHHLATIGALVHQTELLAIFDLAWGPQVSALKGAVAAAIPAGASYIMVDENWLANQRDSTGEVVSGRRGLHFLVRDGAFLGRPSDERSLIAEVARLRSDGADFLVLPWFTGWWLEYYQQFAAYLRGSFRCMVADDRLTVFDLRPSP